jgi:hypothetical protein
LTAQCHSLNMKRGEAERERERDDIFFEKGGHHTDLSPFRTLWNFSEERERERESHRLRKVRLSIKNSVTGGGRRSKSNIDSIEIDSWP